MQMVKSQTHIAAETNKKSNPISTLEFKKKSEEALKKKQKNITHSPPGDFAEKRVLKLSEFSGHCCAIYCIKS